MNEIFFWSMPEFECFSNFYPKPIKVYEEEYPTVEHAFQALKTDNKDDRERISKALTPKEAKQIGRTVTLSDDWDERKYGVMLDCLREKFAYGKPREVLLSSGDRLIYEDSPYDMIWGTGVKGAIGNGKNLLGKALMRVRNEIREEIERKKGENNE